MNAEKVDFLNELSDFKDYNRSQSDQDTICYLRNIENGFQQFNGPIFHVFGNHDLDNIPREQFPANRENAGISGNRSCHYFDSDVLQDVNFKEDDSPDDRDGNFDWSNEHPNQGTRAARTRHNRHFSSDLRFHLPIAGRLRRRICLQFRRGWRDFAGVPKYLYRLPYRLPGTRSSGKFNLREGSHNYTLKAIVNGSGGENNSYAILEIFPDYWAPQSNR